MRFVVLAVIIEVVFVVIVDVKLLLLFYHVRCHFRHISMSGCL